MPLKINPINGNLDLVLSPGGGTVTTSFATDSGTATPTAGGVITFTGVGMAFSGSGNTVTCTLDTPVTVANGGTGASTLTDGGILLGSGTSGITATAQPTNGQLLIGSTGNDPVLATLTAGAGINIVNAAGAITITNTAGAFVWNEITLTSASMSAENGYIANNAALVTLTLPATASVGEKIEVLGKGAGGWKVAQNAGQTIHFIDTDTTTGAGGSLSSTKQYDCIELTCITANTDWVVSDSEGNITIV